MENLYFQEPLRDSMKSNRSSIPENFPFDKPRKKYVGGGGVIAKYESPFR